MLTGTLIYGFVNSVILALVALGFNLTFGICGVANFAYGALYLLAGFFVWILLNPLGLPYPLAVLGSILFTAFLGALIYRFILLRVRGIELSEVMATFGIGLAALELFRWFGFVGFDYTLPTFSNESVDIFGVTLDFHRIYIVIIGIGLTILVWAFTRYTRIGRAFRGVAQDEKTALTLGIDSDFIGMLAVAFGAAIAAIAAIANLPLGTISVDQGYDILLGALAVSILGGLGSTMGVIVAAFCIGYAQTFTAFYINNSWVMVVPSLAILLILGLKPSGLFGKFKELEERV